MTEPLKGYKVIDLSRYVAGPYCAMLLGDMGADVIKIERPEGDDSRFMKPALGDMSTYFMSFNRNKRSITLDLKNPRGKELALQLIKKADILVENFRPGVMERLGLGYQYLREINPRLIMASITGFGQDGPYALRPAFDSIAQAMGGLMNMTGEADGDPLPAGTWVSDYGSGLFAAFGIMVALNTREKTGTGQHIDVALLDTIFSWLRTATPDYLIFNIERSRKGGRDIYRCPVGSFRTKDGYIYVSATTQEQFEGFATAAGHPEWGKDPRFNTESQRLANSTELNKLLSEWTSSLPTEKVLESLIKAEVPCAPVADIKQVLSNPQLIHRGQIVKVKNSKGEEIPLAGINVKLSETPGSVRLAPPGIGEHNEEVFNGLLGLSKAEIDALKKQGVI